MFDIGFPELFLVALVMLVVLGPERLPETLRTAGLWLGRLRRSFASVKAEIEKEVGMDDIKRQLHNEAIMDEMKRLEAQVKGEAEAARAETEAALDTATAPAAEATPDESEAALPQADATLASAPAAEVEATPEAAGPATEAVPEP
ncbi:MAG: Sec-independent protein translocase protein TatB, partial [Pseudomonadota bacterium]